MESLRIVDLPPEIIEEIILRIPKYKFFLFKISQVNTLFRRYCLSRVKDIKNQRDFNNVCKEGFLLSLIINRDKYAFFMDWNAGLYYATKFGSRLMTNFMINNGANNWDLGLAGACRSNSKIFTDMMISKGIKDYNLGLFCAAKGGYEQLVKLMIKHGASNFSKALCYAAKGNQIKIFKLLFEKQKSLAQGDLHRCSFWVGFNNNMEFFKLLLDLHVFSLENVLLGACQAGNINFLWVLMKHGDNCSSEMIECTCIGGHLEILKKLYELYDVEMDDIKLNNCLHEACKYGHIPIIKFLIKKGARDFNRGLEGACQGNQMKAAKLMIEHMIDERISIAWDEVYLYACMGGYEEMITLVLTNKPDANPDIGLTGACVGGHFNVIINMLQRGGAYKAGCLYGALQSGHLRIVLFILELYEKSDSLPEALELIGSNLLYLQEHFKTKLDIDKFNYGYSIINIKIYVESKIIRSKK